MGKFKTGKAYKHKPTGKMIKQIQKMAPGKKIGGDTVHPMSASLPYGLFSSLTKLLSNTAKTATNTGKKVVNTVSNTVKKSKKPKNQTNLEAPPTSKPTTTTSTVDKINNVVKKVQPVLNTVSTVSQIVDSVSDVFNNHKDKKDKTEDIGYVTESKTKKPKKVVDKKSYVYNLNFTNTNNDQKNIIKKRNNGGRNMRWALENQPATNTNSSPPSLGKYNQNARIYSSE